MKYKLKFEIIYPGLSKDEIREMKLETILSSKTEMEVMSDHPISAPSKDDVIILDNNEYFISKIKHKIEQDLYTIIVDVEDIKIKEKLEKEKNEKEMAKILNTFSNFR